MARIIDGEKMNLIGKQVKKISYRTEDEPAAAFSKA